MKVSNLGRSRAVGPSRKTRKASGKGVAFADSLREAARPADPAGPVESAAISSVESVLAVQEVPTSTDERSRGLAQRYGEGLLDRLEEIRRDILLGAIPGGRLADLAKTMRAERKNSDDPRLNEILDEIELRAEVEIAKLTRGA